MKRDRCRAAQGLIHISELSWSMVLTPDAVVQPGSAVRCKVKRVDREKGQIQLSLKARTRVPRCQPPEPETQSRYCICSSVFKTM